MITLKIKNHRILKRDTRKQVKSIEYCYTINKNWTKSQHHYGNI